MERGHKSAAISSALLLKMSIFLYIFLPVIGSFDNTGLLFLHQSVPCHVINSLAPGIFELKFIYTIFKLILVINGWRISYESAHK